VPGFKTNLKKISEISSLRGSGVLGEFLIEKIGYGQPLRGRRTLALSNYVVLLTPSYTVA